MVTPEQLAELRAKRDAAFPGLHVRPAAEPAAAPTPPPRGPCVHLGGQTGERECVTCAGRVRLKVFACAHPAHGETTLAACKACPDWLAGG